MSAMSVQELLTQLSAIEDKGIPVRLMTGIHDATDVTVVRQLHTNGAALVILTDTATYDVLTKEAGE